MKNLLFILLAFFFVACNPQKRLSRLVKKHPELSTVDSIIYRDTFYTNYIRTDTIIKFYNYTDTVFIEKEKLKIKILPVKDNNIYLSGECFPDTIYIEKKIPVEKIKLINKKSKLDSIIIVICLIAGIINIFYIFLYFFNKK